MNTGRTLLDTITLIPLHKNENPAYDEIAILINGRNLIELLAGADATEAAPAAPRPEGTP